MLCGRLAAQWSPTGRVGQPRQSHRPRHEAVAGPLRSGQLGRGRRHISHTRRQWFRWEPPGHPPSLSYFQLTWPQSVSLTGSSTLWRRTRWRSLSVLTTSGVWWRHCDSQVNLVVQVGWDPGGGGGGGGDRQRVTEGSNRVSGSVWGRHWPAERRTEVWRLVQKCHQRSGKKVAGR